jgi:addiction module RelB/DinJ family antitoxin
VVELHGSKIKTNSEKSLKKVIICIAFVLTMSYTIGKYRAWEGSNTIMANKSANLYARIEPDVKKQAETILSTLGISVSSAINMFYKQIILQRGIPFDMKIPETHPLDMSRLTNAQMDEELEKGYADMLEGRTKTADKTFADIRRDYHI